MAGAAIASGIGAFLIYKEKLTPIQISGIVIGTAGLILIGIASGHDGTYLAVVSGVSAFMLFAVKNVFNRTISITGCDSDTNAILNLIGSGLSGVIFAVLIHIFYVDIFEVDFNIWLSFLGGFMKGIGVLFITEAMMLGYIGPTAAIVNTAGGCMVLADFMIYGITTEDTKLIGAALSIFGTIWMMTGDIILYKMKCYVCIPTYVLVDYEKSSKSESLLNKSN